MDRLERDLLEENPSAVHGNHGRGARDHGDPRSEHHGYSDDGQKGTEITWMTNDAIGDVADVAGLEMTTFSSRASDAPIAHRFPAQGPHDDIDPDPGRWPIFLRQRGCGTIRR